MCPHVVQAQITITVCTSKYLNTNKQEAIMCPHVVQHELLLQCVHQIVRFVLHVSYFALHHPILALHHSIGIA